MGIIHDDKPDELNRLIDLEEIIQNLVRELRVRMSSVLRYASLIRSESQEMGTLKYIEKLYMEAHNASKMFDNVITQESGKRAPSCEVCDAGGILRQTVSLLDYQLKTKGILLDINPAAGPLPVNADPFRLQQAFYIVLLNAVQLLKESLSDKKIIVSSGIEANFVRIEISLGAVSSVKQKGEDPLKHFFKTLEKGMGIGWYTLQRTIARYGGSVSLESGETVSFLISLPCAIPVAVSSAPEAAPGIAEKALTTVYRPAALIIDDEVMTGEVTAEMMDHLGFDTVFFDSPLAALPTLRERRFNIIIIDYMMPKMNGIEFIREHGALFGDAEVILMTGFAALDASMAKSDIKVSVLKKPFALKELKCLVQKIKNRPQTHA